MKFSSGFISKSTIIFIALVAGVVWLTMHSGDNASEQLEGVTWTPFDAKEAVLGLLQDDSLELRDLSADVFDINTRDAQQLSERLGFSIEEGQYTYIVLETKERIATTTGITYQIGLGFAPDGRETRTSGTDGETPITAGDHAFALYQDDVPDQVGSGAFSPQLYDLVENFARTYQRAPMMAHSNGTTFEFLIPQIFIGKVGETVIITPQIFGRQTPAGKRPTYDDPTGVSGGTLTITELPQPQKIGGGVIPDGMFNETTSPADRLELLRIQASLSN